MIKKEPNNITLYAWTRYYWPLCFL